MSDEFVSALEKLVDRASTEGSEPFFRAVTTEEGRRALRLERSFWNALEFIAKEYQVSVGEIVACIERAHFNDKNLASAVRHICVYTLAEQVSETRGRLSESNVQNFLNACPSPAFVLSLNRQLEYTNQAFLKYVRTNFSGPGMQETNASLRLQIDTPMEELIARLAENQNRPITVGFALGMSERRVRGNINAMLAPEWRQQMLLGFIVS
jgi:predicted DNA-binding ribbon-helix-helix protein